MTHVAQQTWISDIGYWTWTISNMYESLVRWSVPVFVMISGALFLGGKQDFRTVLSKNTLKLVSTLTVWGVIYFAEGLILGMGLGYSAVSVVYGPLWFLFMLIGLYLIIPFLRKITETEGLTIYFLALAVVMQFLVPCLIKTVGYISGDIANLISIAVDDFAFYLVLGYSGYYVLGYYLNTKAFGKHIEKWIYVGGICAFILCPLTTHIMSVKNNALTDCYGNLTVGILLESAAVFVFFKNHSNREIRIYRYIRMISKHSFGIYLVHKIVIDVLNQVFQFNWFLGSTIFSIPLMSLLIFVISGIVTVLLSKITWFRKIAL